MTSLSSLIRAYIPVHLHLYLAISVVFAQMDIFSGEDFYESHLQFKETESPNELFAFFGVENSNFMLNSGSYFVIQISLILYYFVMYFINKICTCCPSNQYVRRLGMFVYEQSYLKSLINASLKLFLESYFDLVICTMVNL